MPGIKVKESDLLGSPSAAVAGLALRLHCSAVTPSLPVSPSFVCKFIHQSIHRSLLSSTVSFAFISIVFPTSDAALCHLGNSFRSCKITPSSPHAFFYLLCIWGLFICVFKHFRLLIGHFYLCLETTIYSVILLGFFPLTSSSPDYVIYICLVKRICMPSRINVNPWALVFFCSSSWGLWDESLIEKHLVGIWVQSLGTCVVRGENQVPKVVLWPLHMYRSM